MYNNGFQILPFYLLSLGAEYRPSNEMKLEICRCLFVKILFELVGTYSS